MDDEAKKRKRVCTIRCREAKGKRCKCVCGGATHGSALVLMFGTGVQEKKEEECR